MKKLRAEGAQGEYTLEHKTLRSEHIIEDTDNPEQKGQEGQDPNKRQSHSEGKEGSFTTSGGYACI